MSKRAFDILPPYPPDKPRTYHHHNDKKETHQKSVQTFLIFIFGLFFVFVLFSFVKSNDFILSNSPNATTSNTQKNNFELFDNQGSSNLSNQNEIISVKLQDASSSGTNLALAKDKLLGAGFKITSTEKVANIIPETIIYYKKGQIAQAKIAFTALSANFNPKMKESTTLENNYDLLISIGDL